MKKFTFALVAGLLLLCTVVPARASDLTLFGGVQREGKLSLQSAAGAITSSDGRSFGTYGVRFSQGRVLGSEHTLAYSPNFLSTQSHAFFYHSNILVQAPLPVIRPYLTFGLGTAYIGGNVPPRVHGAKLAVNYGGGVKLKFAGPLGVQFDARGYRLFGLQGQSINMLEVTAGIGLFF